MGSSVHNDPTVSAELAQAFSRCKAMLQWPVPVFFMITGFLWLRPGKECTFSNVLPNIRRFVLVLFTVGWAYALMERVFTVRTFHLPLLLSSLGDVFTGRLWDHMWYLYAAIGVYLVLPVLKPFFDTQPVRHQGLLCALLWCFSVFASFLEERYGYHLPVDLPLGAPLFYVCTGGVLAGLTISRRTAAAASFIFLAGSLLCAAGADPAPMTSLTAPALFIAVTGFAAERASSAGLSWLAQCTFGIYLFQQFYINLMIKALHIYPLRYPALPALLIASVMVFLFSLATAALLRCIPVVRKYLL